MNLKTKKILAREFLILISAVILTFLFFCSIYIYNYSTHYQLNRLDSAIFLNSSRADSLKKTYDIKLNNQESYFNSVTSEFDLTKSGYNTCDKLWERLAFLAKTDSIKNRWDEQNGNFRTFHIKLGYNNPLSFKKFIESNILTNQEISNYNKRIDINKILIQLNQQRNNKETEIISRQNQLNYSFKVLIILLVILFGIRYLVYIIIKSVKILKQQSE